MKILEFVKYFIDLGSAIYNRLWKDLKDDPIRTIYTLIMVYIVMTVITLSISKIYVEVTKKQIHIIIDPESFIDKSK